MSIPSLKFQYDSQTFPLCRPITPLSSPASPISRDDLTCYFTEGTGSEETWAPLQLYLIFLILESRPEEAGG